MSAAFQKLRSKLSELFQLDAAAELDFGIYRILNARRVEISEFLDSLGGQVDRILAEAMDTGAGEARAELAKAEADLRAMGLDDAAVAAVPKIRELRGKIATGTSDPTALSHEIFSHLATFFSRYYQDGDFISLRRYKKDTYAIPYEGEEVKLHWANADQYYIKSSETLRDYSFRLGPAPKEKEGDKPDTRPTVTFKLVEADIEKDNAKAVAGQERRFVFQGVVDSDSKDHLVLGFAYLPLGKAEKQAALNEAAAKAILTDHAKGAFTDLAAKDPTYTGKEKGGRSILAKHLAEYTGRNTFDYFVHKDLGGFLRRELDFYIKNEVLHLDDLDEAPEANWNETRAKLKALRTIAAKVIRFLAQLEDFQKKLWLKKKFVTACDYVVTLDRIPEELYPEIAACDAQREEWVRLFAIDEIKGDLGRTGYSVPLTVEFLRENKGLLIDTRLVTEIREKTTTAVGIGHLSTIINADNFQSLLTMRSMQRRIGAIFTDPPYNTGVGDFSYKDSFQHSSWLSMIEQLLSLAKTLLTQEASSWMTIDDREVAHLRLILEKVLGKDRFVASVAWEKVYSPRMDAIQFSSSIDHILVSAMNPNWMPNHEIIEPNLDQFPHVAEDGERYRSDPLRKWGKNSLRSDRPNLWFPIISPCGIEVWPIKPDGTEACWRWQKSTVQEKYNQLDWLDKGNGLQPYVRQWAKDSTRRPVETLWSYEDAGSTHEAQEELKKLLPNNRFATPKPTKLIAKVCRASGDENLMILDTFAGSGTTGHAVINLNREDGGDRKYILIEMGEHFDTVLVPRLKKVIYSSDWKDGKPQNRNTGVSHCFKILRLESYEDTLNNLRLSRTRAQELALEAMTPEAREDYRLGYMLDLEASGSQSLLNVSAFTNPWNYTMEIATGTAGETKTTKVDLVETFNWLLGLTVLAQGHGGGVQWVEGTNPEGDKVLVLWRNTTEVDADALNDWCKKQKISVLDGEFGLIYVNGDHHLENLRRDDQTWKVRLTDEEFPKLMWEGC